MDTLRKHCTGFSLAFAIACALLSGLTSFTAVALDTTIQHGNSNVLELQWHSLMPAGFSMESLLPDNSQAGGLSDNDPAAGQLMDKMMSALASAPVVEDFAGMTVKIPGFPVPVVYEGNTVTEFFLVPYFGACIHVPPPPSNQIIYVRYPAGITVKSLYDAVWVTGTLLIESTTNQMASSGYGMDADSIEVYK